MPPKGSARSHAQVAADDVLRSACFLPGVLSSARSLTDWQQQWRAVAELGDTLSKHKQQKVGLRKLILQSQLSQQLCKCLVLVLQQTCAAAATAASVDPQEPTLALAAQLASSWRLLASGTADDHYCQQVVYDGGKDSSE
jgi:hypothetical protein